MPEGPEIETQELQDKVHEAHAEAAGHGSPDQAWTRSIALTTALFAVIAAIGALQAGSLVNEAMIDQIKASDVWNEYQASREKTHIYTVATNTILDTSTRPSANLTPGGSSPANRAKEYQAQLAKEAAKAKELSAKAKELEKSSEEKMHRHHLFAYQVALLQVTIALGAVSALTRVRWVWSLSLGVGIIGVILFVLAVIK